jgi:hypothetical protein
VPPLAVAPGDDLKNVTHVPIRPAWVTFSMTVMKNVAHVRGAATWVTFSTYAAAPCARNRSSN